jgi:diadenosine tetraphosphate (Ap4A) HIT family hydrolase
LVAGCSVCDYLRKLTPDQTILQNEHWIAGPMLDVPGWVMLMTRQHREGVWSLSDAEAASLGTMARDIAGALVKTVGAERVHMAAQGEVALHYHCGLLPRRPGETPVFNSMDLVTRAEHAADPAEARAVAARLAEYLELTPAD